jgi:hypothetical protein
MGRASGIDDARASSGTPGASSNSSDFSGTTTDTISLSDQAKSYLTAVTNADASNNPQSGSSAASPSLQSATGRAALNAEIQLLQQQATAEGGTATVQNASDVPGLDFQENVQQISGGTRVSVNFNSQVFQSNPNNAIVFDSNPADAKLVTV